jgi:hypothetical protein
MNGNRDLDEGQKFWTQKKEKLGRESGKRNGALKTLKKGYFRFWVFKTDLITIGLLYAFESSKWVFVSFWTRFNKKIGPQSDSVKADRVPDLDVAKFSKNWSAIYISG